MRDTSPLASASQSSPSAGLGSLVANAAAAARARDPGHTDDENSKVVDTPVLRWGPRRGVEGLKCPERAVSKDHPLLFVALDRKAAQSEPTTSPNEALAALSTSDGTFYPTTLTTSGGRRDDNGFSLTAVPKTLTTHASLEQALVFSSVQITSSITAPSSQACRRLLCEPNPWPSDT